MYMPSVFRDYLFDDWFGFPEFPDMKNTEKKLYGRRADRLMKTDVRDKENSYEVDIDLPGFKKEDIQVDLENGYLTIKAEKSLEKETNDAGKTKEKENDKYIRRERYSGSMQRSFYVGDAVMEDDIKAAFKHGVLSLSIPKKKQEIPQKSRILIEG